MKLPLLDGTDDPAKYTVLNDDGKPFNPIEAVVPIFFIEKVGPQHLQFIGTGFFIAQDLIVTAKHVLEGIYSNEETGTRQQLRDPYIVHSDGNSRFTYRPLISQSISTVADICIAQVRPMHGRRNMCLPLKRDMPRDGDIAFTFAFPNTTVELGENGRQEIRTNPAYYRGQVVEVFPKGRDTTLLTWPCIHVNFHMHPGSSGGPVFDTEGRVFGINCMSWEPDRNFAYATAIKTIREAAVRNAIFESRFYEVLRLKKLISAGVIRFA